LEGNNKIIKDETELKDHITSFYQNLFGSPTENNFSMMENRVDDIPQVTDEGNDILTTMFTEEEIKEAIFQMEHNKASGPDGFLAEFYQVFWQVMKADLMAMFYDFHKGELPLYSLNFGIITLLPKCEEAIRIQQYRPICLLN
jgi:hypothetical protein